MAMVHAATHAYEHKEGWADDAPPTDAYPQEQHLVAADPVKPRDAPEEFYKAPPKQGYFYANNKVSESNTRTAKTHISPVMVRSHCPTPRQMQRPRQTQMWIN